MTMPGRSFAAQTPYRYGFNGKELDNSTAEGSYDFGARIYDSRIGKFLSVDPDYEKYIFQSTYAYAINNPIRMVDFYGKGPGDPLPAPNLDYTFKWKIDGRATKSNEYYDGLWINRTNSRDATNTLLHVTDDKGVSYWVIKESYGVVAHLSNGMALPVQENNYYYFTKPPSNKKGAYKGGEWKSFKTQNQVSAEAGYKSADALGIGMFGVCSIITGGISTYGVISTYGAAAVGTFIGEEIVEEVFEKVTGIPVIMNPIDLAKNAFRKAIRSQVKETLVEKYGKEATEKFGSYTIKYADGTKYHGAGNVEEAIQRAYKKSENGNGKLEAVTEFQWTPSPTRPQQFRDEAKRLNTDKGGFKNPINRNNQNSPGNVKYKDPAND